MFRISLNKFKYYLFCLVILLLPFMTYIRVGGKTMNLSYADLVLPLLLVITYIKPTKVADWRIRKYNKYLTIFLFIMLFSIVNIIKWGNYGAGVKAFFLALLKFLICFLYVQSFNQFFDDYKHQINKIIDVFIIASALDAFLAYVGVFLRNSGIPNSFVFQNSFRACGSFSDPNLFSCFMFIGLYMTAHCYQQKQENKYFILMFFQAGAVILSASKAAIIAMGLCIIWVLIGRLRTLRRTIKVSKLLILALITILCVIIINRTNLFSSAFRRFTTLVNQEDDISTGRFSLWSRSLVLIKNNPILGVGFGLHNIAAEQLHLTVGEFIFHNTYLNYFVELGLLGLIWLISSLYNIIRCQIVFYRNTGNRLATGFLFSVLFMAFTLDLENFRNLWIFFGLVITLTTNSIEENNGEKK